jgi:leucyl-tRNA synthetase
VISPPPCSACGRPVAMARAYCVYCGASLSAETLEAAALAMPRVKEWIDGHAVVKTVAIRDRLVNIVVK